MLPELLVYEQFELEALTLPTSDGAVLVVTRSPIVPDSDPSLLGLPYGEHLGRMIKRPDENFMFNESITDVYEVAE